MKKKIAVRSNLQKKRAPSIHIKLEYAEALGSKKDILITQSNLIKLNNCIRNYQNIRLRELKRKINLHNKIKQLINSINHLEKVMPEVKVPQFVHQENTTKETPFTKSFMQKTTSNPSGNSDIEAQLREIQEKIKSLKR